MTYIEHIHGKHYLEIKGSTVSVWLYRWSGHRVGKVKTKIIYRGVKK